MDRIFHMFGCHLRRLATRTAVLSLFFSAGLCAQNTGPYERATLLVVEQKEAEAMALIEEGLAKNPQDPQWLYLKALSSMPKQAAQAQSLLEALIRNHPELPEPYNALAVLLASKSEFGMALQYLQQALAQRPQYRQALENLGDVHLAMAWQAYQAAQQTGSPNLAPRIGWIEQQLRWSPKVQTPPSPAPAQTRTAP
jgi:tetratricopeptide (TPR) repeat protein